MDGKCQLRGLWSCRSLVHPREGTGQGAKTLLLATLCGTSSPLPRMGKMDVFGLPAPDSAALVAPSLSFLSQFCFSIFHFLSLSPLLPFLSRGVLASTQGAGTSSAPWSTALSQGSSVSLPQGTPSSLLGGLRRAKLLFFFPFPLLHEFSFPALGWLLNTPLAIPRWGFALPALACALVPQVPPHRACGGRDGSRDAPCIRQRWGERKPQSPAGAVARVARREGTPAQGRGLRTGGSSRAGGSNGTNPPLPDGA